MASQSEDVFEDDETPSKDLTNLPDDIPTLKKIIQQKDNNLNVCVELKYIQNGI